MSYLLLVRTSRAFLLFFFNDTAPTEIYTLSLHDALPISPDFSIAPSQTGLTITAGQSASMNIDRKSTRLKSSHLGISYAVFCLKKKNAQDNALRAWLDEAKNHTRAAGATRSGPDSEVKLD